MAEADRDARGSTTALDELVAKADTGARAPSGWQGRLIAVVAFTWSLFQLYTASTLPFTLAEWLGVNITLNSTETRQVHLAFALFLGAAAFPLLRSAPRDRIPWYDWVLGLGGAAACLYLFVFQDAIAQRPGLPTTTDLVVSTIGLVLLLVATYRALGLPLVIVASVFLVYVFFGNRDFIPEAIQWRGASYGKAMWHFWMQTEGVFGVALGVSASFVFLFVLFGSLLDRAGAGNYFIKVSFAALGHMRGGPAKAAVLSSGMTGLISGSSIANVVTTGTFTIPLMKRVGFSAEKAGAVEVASSVNGQIMPPVMGAAAFLMVEFVGLTYLEVIQHAFLPAVISYIALIYIVHLEALKADLRGLPRPGPAQTLLRKLIGFLTGFIGIAVMVLAVYYGFGWVKRSYPEDAFLVAAIVVVVAYVVLLYIAARRPDLEVDDPNAPITELPRLGPTVLTGLYFILPIFVLVWCLVIERFSPGLSAFWASLIMLAILLTQRVLKAMMRGEGELGRRFLDSLGDIWLGMIAGARNMIGIAVATGAAGIIVGTVSLTGFHQVIGEFIEFLSGGHLMLMLLLVAVMSLILGMGLPTTANYIVVSSLMAAVVVDLGAAQGLIVPLIAVHLFVFYFGIMADVTPPVGLASFAAAAVSGGDPLKTGVTAFWYSLRTAALPFLFIFNNQLLLIGIDHWWQLVVTIVIAVIAMLVFAAATMGYFLVRNRLWETAALLLIAFTLFRPGFWMDRIYPPFEEVPPADLETVAADPEREQLRLRVSGETFEGDYIEKAVMLPLGEGETGAERLEASGLTLRQEDGRVFVDMVGFGSRAERLGLDLDMEIEVVLVPADVPAKEWMFIPALLLLAGVMAIQRGRRERAPRPAAEGAM